MVLKRLNKKICTALAIILCTGLIGGAVGSVEQAQASTPVAIDVHKDKAELAVDGKIQHLTYSLKNNYLGIKNQATWEQYLKEARALNKQVKSESLRRNYEFTLNKIDKLIQAVARVNQVEKSMEKNAHIMRNTYTWVKYLELAENDLKKVDNGIFLDQKEELRDRIQVVDDAIDEIRNEYDATISTYEGDYSIYLDMYFNGEDESMYNLYELRHDVEQLNSDVRKDFLLDKIDKTYNALRGKDSNKIEKLYNIESTGAIGMTYNTTILVDKETNDILNTSSYIRLYDEDEYVWETLDKWDDLKKKAIEKGRGIKIGVATVYEDRITTPTLEGDHFIYFK